MILICETEEVCREFGDKDRGTGIALERRGTSPTAYHCHTNRTTVNDLRGVVSRSILWLFSFSKTYNDASLEQVVTVIASFGGGDCYITFACWLLYHICISHLHKTSRRCTVIWWCESEMWMLSWDHGDTSSSLTPIMQRQKYTSLKKITIPFWLLAVKQHWECAILYIHIAMSHDSHVSWGAQMWDVFSVCVYKCVCECVSAHPTSPWWPVEEIR